MNIYMCVIYIYMYILFSYKLLWSGGPSSPPASLIIKVLTQEEVGSQVLIFFTREVGLDHQALGEAQCLQLWGDGQG